MVAKSCIVAEQNINRTKRTHTHTQTKNMPTTVKSTSRIPVDWFLPGTLRMITQQRLTASSQLGSQKAGGIEACPLSSKPDWRLLASNASAVRLAWGTACQDANEYKQGKHPWHFQDVFVQAELLVHTGCPRLPPPPDKQ